MGEEPRWIELHNPSADELRARLPVEVQPGVEELLLAPLQPGDEPRPRIQSHGTYVVVVVLVAVAVPSEERVLYQELDLVVTPQQILVVTKVPPGEPPYDTKDVREACKPNEPVGMDLFRLLDDVAEDYLDLVDDLNDEIDELEGHIETSRADTVRRRVAAVRRDLLRVRRHLTPLRDATHKVVDGRIELDGAELFPRAVVLHFGEVYDKFLHATEGLETSRELLAGVRDYLQAKIANDQNEVTKRLTAVASLLLVPTFIVGLYGQNFRDIPELGWAWGYWWSWALILVATLAQLWFFRRKRWI